MVLAVPRPAATLADVLASGSVRCAYQPIVDLGSGAVVAYEALARGPEGPLGSPSELFEAARVEGLLVELDEACRDAAVRGAVAQGLLAPLTLFVNVEPAVLDGAPLHRLAALAASVTPGVRVVLEITERALAARPAELLRTVERVRDLGWAVALDDVGADPASLAFMPLLRPDVVKLDLSLVQGRPGPEVAEVMNAVNAYAERSGAVLLAEGIETEAHVAVASALGATLGQGWHFGAPEPGPVRDRPVGELALPRPRPVRQAAASPFGSLPPGTVLRRSPKALLVEVSKQLEREAMRLGRTCVVASTFQEARHFTPATRQRYRDLADRVGFVCALGEDLPAEPAPGVRGATLAPGDEVRGEWDVTVLAPHFSAALLARDLGDRGPDRERLFEYALTYDRDAVVAATGALLGRVLPALPALPTLPTLPGPDAPDPADEPARRLHLRSVPTPRTPADPAVPEAVDGPLLRRALAATASGVTIVDTRRPDQPLVYVNAAFEALTGFTAAELLGRNARFLQGPDSDREVTGRIRAAVAEGRECRETVLNYRGPQRVPWWNEIYLAPVTDPDGRVLHYIGVQNDVTERVAAQRELEQERDRARSYLARIEALAFTDPLTGLLNRRRLEERVEGALERARDDGGAVALLFLDLDGFKAVNDALGHASGDELLRVVGERLTARLRRTDLLARLGGDEFLVALLGLDQAHATEHAAQIAEHLVGSLTAPVDLAGTEVSVGVSVGTSVSGADGSDFGALLHLADVRMYAAKQAGR